MTSKKGWYARQARAKCQHCGRMIACRQGVMNYHEYDSPLRVKLKCPGSYSKHDGAGGITPVE